MNRTAVIIVNWNGWKDTIECLESFDWPLPNAHFFILDNDSTDDSVSQLERYCKDRSLSYTTCTTAEIDRSDDAKHQLSLVRNPSNMGFAGGNNVVLKHLLRTGAYRYAWLLNNDTVIKKDTLFHLQDHLQADPSRAFSGSVLLDYSRPDLVQCCGVNYYKYLGVSKLYLKNMPWKEIGSTLARSAPPANYYQIGASLLVDLSKLTKIGLMDEIFFLYSEEADWQIRAQKMGYGNGLAPESVIYHKGNMSTAGRKHVFFFHYNKSAIILTRKNFGLIASLTSSISLIGITMIRGKLQLKATLYGMKGIIAGWRTRIKTL